MSRVRLFAVMAGVACLLALPSSASALKFGPLASGASLTDATARANALAAADFNGDGRDDIAAGSMGNGIQIRLASAGGWVTAPTANPTSGGAYSIATGDFNEDGNADLVESDYYCGGSCPPSPAVLIGNGDGTFGAAININSNISSPSNFHGLTVGDANDDGNLDVIVSMGLGEFGIAYGNGSGGFTLAQRTQIPDAPHSNDSKTMGSTVGDFNGDGVNDIAFGVKVNGDPSASAIYLMLGDGSGGLTPSTGNPYPVGQPGGYIDALKATDFNGDGNDDLAASVSGTYDAPPAQNGGSIQTWLGDDEEDMVANPPATIVRNDGDEVRPDNVRVGDFDGDGNQDLAWFEIFQPNGPPEWRMMVAKGDGSGGFTVDDKAPWVFPDAGGYAIGFVSGDFNADGAPDFAMSSWNSTGGLFFLENQTDLGTDRDSVDFGNILYNEFATQTVKIQHDGGPSAQIDQVTLTGNDGTFQLTGTSCAGVTLHASSCEQGVKVNEPTPGAHSATLHVTFVGLSQTLDIPLSVNSLVPKASFDPTSIDLGEIRDGQNRSQTVTVTSTGTAPVSFFAASVGGTDAGHYSITGNTCSGQSIAVGSTCTVTVKGTASAAGDFDNAWVNLPNAGYQSPQDFSLSFTGIDPGIGVSPTGKDFGPVGISDSLNQEFVVQSVGSTDLHITDVAVSSGVEGDFTLTDNSCIGIFAPGGSCEIEATFEPQPGSSPSRTGQIEIETNAGDDPILVPLTGTALKADASFTPDEIDFGDVPVGTSASQTVTVDSVGDIAMKVEEAWVNGPDGDDFSLTDDTCSAQTVATGCSYTVTFTPASRGEKEAYSGVWGPNVDEEITVSGKGIQPAGKFDVQGIGFEDAVIGASSNRPTETFNLMSTGPDPLTVDSVAIAGADADSFKITSNGCGATVPAGSSCAVEVTFDPQGGSPGKRTATLRATTDAGVFESSLSGLAVNTPPTPTYKASLRVKAPKKAKAGRKFTVAATVANTGTGSLSGLVLKYKATQGKGSIKLPTVATGKKLTKRLKVTLKKRRLKRGKPVKLSFTLIRQGRTIAKASGTTRLDFGQPKIRRPHTS